MNEPLLILGRLIYTMDGIEVHGEENLSKMLGCIQELKRLKSLLEGSGRKEASA